MDLEIICPKCGERMVVMQPREYESLMDRIRALR